MYLYITARRDDASGGQQLVKLAGLVELPQLGVAADGAPVDHDLGHRPAAGQLLQARTEARVVAHVDLLERDPLPVQERLGPDAVAAPGRGVHLDLRHVYLNARRAPGVPEPRDFLRFGDGEILRPSD